MRQEVACPCSRHFRAGLANFYRPSFSKVPGGGELAAPCIQTGVGRGMLGGRPALPTSPRCLYLIIRVALP